MLDARCWMLDARIDEPKSLLQNSNSCGRGLSPPFRILFRRKFFRGRFLQEALKNIHADESTDGSVDRESGIEYREADGQAGIRMHSISRPFQGENVDMNTLKQHLLA